MTEGNQFSAEDEFEKLIAAIQFGTAPIATKELGAKARDSEEHPAKTSASINLIRPLGHMDGTYFFIPPSGELRRISAEKLEAGRGVRAIFAGGSPEVIEACLREFPNGSNDWCPKKAGLSIIEQCNQKGVVDPANLDLRASGVWRHESGEAIMHCGDQVVRDDGSTASLMEFDSNQLLIAGPSVQLPEFGLLPCDTMSELLHRLEGLWGWSRASDACIWLGFVALASLGGYPAWRPHLYVSGSRGSGKSTLLQAAANLLGDLSGEPINDATEAGLRQSRNNQARPLLIDEFEPDASDRGGTRQDNILGLLRRMSGGSGGRISRGSADHKAVAFKILGSAYLTSINHIHFEPQDRSRFAVLELNPLQNSAEPIIAARNFQDFLATCRNISNRFRGRMLAQSGRWDRTFESVKARAQSKGADARQAETAAAILTGLDLALHDGELDGLRLSDLDEPLDTLLGDASEAPADCEGQDALDFLLSAFIPTDRGEKRSIREMLESVICNKSAPDNAQLMKALNRHGVFVDEENRRISLRVGKTNQTAEIFAKSKWKNGAHKSALAKLDGADCPKNPVRVSRHEQHRIIQLPYDHLGFQSRRFADETPRDK